MPIVFTAARDVPTDAGVLAVPVFEGPSPVPDAAAEVDGDFLTAQGFEGKPGQTAALLAEDGSMVLAVGMGKPEAVKAETFRKAGAAVARAASRAEHVAVAVTHAAGDGLDPAAAGRAFAEGLGLAAYEFTRYRSEAKPVRIDRVTVTGRGRNVQAGLDRAAAVVAAVSRARDLVNEPAGTLTPQALADTAADIAASSDRFELTVWDEERIAAEGMGALHGVSLGSAQPPRFIRLAYEPAGRPRGTLALVGKGITFDSGGLSLKTADGMMAMKTDMGGAAAVLATMGALPAFGVRTRVIAYVPATENMPGGHAIKPGDVVRARNGKTIEVLNTDAEGRLVLADGLSLAVEDGPDAVVDIATLTGAQVVALGKRIAGLMGNDDGFLGQVEEAAGRAGEGVWRLPLPDEYRPHIDSDIADVKNIGNPGQAGTLIGGLFLREFVEGVPWAHLDIAGPARADGDDGYVRKGGTGFGVRTLLELAAGFVKPRR